MINPNTEYNNLLLAFSSPLSSLSYPNCSMTAKIRKISSIIDMKFFPTYCLESDSFLARATSAISSTKKQIMVLLNSSVHTQFLSSTQNVYEALRELSGDPIEILETKTVKCYQNILLIEQENEEIKSNKCFKTLKKILQQLVRFSIIYNEYQKRKDLVKSETEIELLSDSDGSSCEEQEEGEEEATVENLEQEKRVVVQQQKINQKLIKSIQTQVLKREFYDLVIEYLHGERVKLKETKQICRICEVRVCIQEMTIHLESCQRKYSTLQELELNKTKLLKLQAQIQLSQPHQNQIYSLVSQHIDEMITHHNQHNHQVFSFSNSISEMIFDLEGQDQDADALIRFKRLACERNHLIEKLKHITVMKQEASILLGVDSIIKDNQKQTDIDSEIKEVSWIKQTSHISLESNSSKVNERKIHSQREPKKSIHRPLPKPKKSVHWNQKAINTKKSLKNFQLLKLLGAGAFGKVYLVRDILTHDTYAVKCIKMDNELLSKENNIQNLKNQHNIFRKIEGEFLVKAAFSFSEGSMHMFFLEYMPGGDFAALLQDQVYLEEDVAKFYLAEIVLAIEHLHNMNIIHRDLKPANLVFDEKGHLKLTDFGLSKQGITKKLLITKEQSSSSVKEEISQPTEILKTSKSNFSKRKTLVRRQNQDSSNKTIVGTPDYIAPEVLNGISTENSSIDWWSFGVIVYETLIGVRPFGDNEVNKVFTNIRNMAIEWPPTGDQEGCISPLAKDLIESLLNINFSKRLGAESIDQIKTHGFFSGINWQKLKSQIPPLPPKIKSDINLRQDTKLRKQIQKDMNEIYSTLNQKIELDDYMRIDLLSQTTAKAFKQIKLKKTKVSYLYKQCVEKVQSMQDIAY